ncbi:MAG: WD40/YVTN/BNR-like repeat-containing protein, partial [Planctomycetota bacterium]
MKRIVQTLAGIALILVITEVLFAQDREGDQTQGPKKTQELKEDPNGRGNWWRDQRTFPTKDIPAQARSKAIEQKRLMQAAKVLSDERIDVFREDVKGRHEFWRAKRIYPKDEMPKGARVRALTQKNRMKRVMSERMQKSNSPPVLGQCNWVSIGPRNINGRVRCLAIHPTNGAIIYAGAAEGGVWKSTDFGQSWVPLMQYEDAIAVGSLAIDPSNASVIYAGTGEPTSWPGYDGVGVLKSTNGGVTWTPTGSLGNGHIARVAIDPTSTTTVYCAGFSGGLYKSTNGGTSWTQILSGDVTDFALNPTTTTIMYAGKRNDGLYKSTDGGATWNKLAGGLPAAMSNRVMVSVCAADPLVVYTKFDRTVYKTTDGGTTWTNLGDHGGNTYGYWCTYVAVDPTNPDIVFAAGVSVEKSTNGGTTWTVLSSGTNWEIDRLHPDQHAMVFDPTDHTKLYAGNDGGVYYSTNSGNNWKKVS